MTTKAQLVRVAATPPRRAGSRIDVGAEHLVRDDARLLVATARGGVPATGDESAARRWAAVTETVTALRAADRPVPDRPETPARGHGVERPATNPVI